MSYCSLCYRPITLLILSHNHVLMIFVDSEAIDYDERDELLSEVTSDTTFFDEEASQSRISFATTNSKDNLTARTSLLAGNRNSHNNLTGASNASDVMKDIWSFTFFRMDGKVAVIGKSICFSTFETEW